VNTKKSTNEVSQ